MILILPIIISHLLRNYSVHIFLHVDGLRPAVFISVIAGFVCYKLRTKRLLLGTVVFTILVPKFFC